MEYHRVKHLAIWHHPAKSGEPVARLLIVHGLGEHSARHMNTVNYLTAKGYEVVRFDLRGSGQSGGKRQWVEKFDDYVQDVAIVYNWIEKELAPLPLFVLGHSLGGAVALCFVEVYQRFLTGMILSSPAYLVGTAVSPLKIWAGRKIVRWAPALRLPNLTDYDVLSKDKSVGLDYRKDPLSCHFNTLNQGNEILNTLPTLAARCHKITIPSLIVHGTHDSLILPQGSFELLKSLVAAPSRHLMLIPFCRHEAHNDHEKEIYFSYLTTWLQHRLSELSARKDSSPKATEIGTSLR